MNNTYSIKDIINLLLSHLWLIILITLIGGAAGYGYSRYMLPLEYSSHITMYVQSYTNITDNTSVNNINYSKQLVNTYMEVLKDDAVLNAVGAELKEEFAPDVLQKNFSVNSEGNIAPASIRSCLAISSVSDTSAVKIAATARDPEVAAAICNVLTQVAPEYVEDAVGVGSINTIDTAKVYRAPVGPNTPKNAAMGLAAGFVLIVLILFVIDFFDNTIKSSDALGEKYNKAIIGEIQEFGEGKGKKKSDENEYIKLTDESVPFFIVESYKSIRTNITFALSTVDKKIFAVSSANPGEGKSTTVANLAIAMAQGGNKVLLIDADMRKSVQHKIFGIKNRKGLSTAISRMHSLADCIQENVMENLDVMTSGPIPPNPSELLASDAMGEILSKLSEMYDAILIDTPPVNVVTDAMELAKYVSGIVMVVRYAATTDEDVEIVFKRMELANMNLLGFILNGVKSKRHGYYSKYHKSKYYYKYKKYGYGYGYGGKPEIGNDPEESETPETPALTAAEPQPAPVPEPVAEPVPEPAEQAEAAAPDADATFVIERPAPAMSLRMEMEGEAVDFVAGPNGEILPAESIG